MSCVHGSVNGSRVHTLEIVLADLFLYEVDKRVMYRNHDMKV